MSGLEELWFSKGDISQSELAQGDIVLLNNEELLAIPMGAYFVSNPACDLAQEKSDFINLVGSGDLRSAIKDILSDLNLTDDSFSNPMIKKTFEKCKTRLMSQINGKIGHRWFFVPANNVNRLPLTVFDCQQIYTLPIGKIDEIRNLRVARMNSPFKEQLVTRLYSYLTRVGTDDNFKSDYCDLILEASGIKLDLTGVDSKQVKLFSSSNISYY